MTEKEKMLNGWIYNANYDNELLDISLQTITKLF